MSTKTQDPPFSRFTRQASRALDAASGGGAFCEFVGSDPTWTPAVNLYEGPAAYRVCCDLAGVDRAAIDVTVRPARQSGESPRLILRGERPVPRPPAQSSTPGADPSRSRVHRMEIDHGPFAREVDLPDDVDQEAISATYRAGMLWVELPKRR